MSKLSLLMLMLGLKNVLMGGIFGRILLCPGFLIETVIGSFDIYDGQTAC